MSADHAPQLLDVADARARVISSGERVKLALLRGPDEVHDASVFLEIWEPGASQPLNSHPRSVETFLFLKGEGVAYCDDVCLAVRAGQLLVLPARSLHRIESDPASKLFAITTMTPDDGFAAVVGRGEEVDLDDEERSVLAQAAGSADDA